MRTLGAIRFVTLVSAVLSGTALAQPSAKPMQIVDAVGLRSLPAMYPIVSFSPHGEYLAYTACDPRQVDMKKDGIARTNATRITAGCSVWIRPYDEKSSYRDGRAAVIAHEGAAWAPSWSPDGRRVAFYGEDPEGIHLWIWDHETRTSRRVADEVVDVSVGGEIPLWSTDGERIYTKVRSGSTGTVITNKVPTTIATVNETADTPRAPWALPGDEGATVRVLRSGTAEVPEPPPVYPSAALATVEVATGKITPLATDKRINAFWLSPDRRWLTFTYFAGEGAKDEWSYKWNLDLIDLANGQVRTLVTINQAHGKSVQWAPDSRSLAYFSGPRNDSLASCFVISIDGIEPRRLLGAANFGTMSRSIPVWDGTSTFVYAVDEHTLWRGDVRTSRFTAIGTWPDRDLLRILVSDDDSGAWSIDDGATVHIETRDRTTRRGELIRVNVETGALRVLRDEALSIAGRYDGRPLVSPSGRFFAYTAQNGQHSPDLWSASTDLARRQQLTALNPEFDAYTLGAQRLIKFRGLDGTPLEATLLLPAGYTPGKRYPLVTWVYGSSMGSNNAYQFGLTPTNAFNMQMLATRGYAVLFPDVPLTTGAHIKSLMNAVMPALDEAIGLGIADPQRLAVMGQSSGGYATLSLVTQTNRFKAAIMCAGFGELASFYGHGWIPWSETGNGALGAAPWEAPQRYVENSPVYYLDRIQTPLLIQHADQDPAVGEFPKHVFTSLERLEKNATYLRYRGEGHVLASHANLVDFWNRITAFLDGHLKD